MSIIQFLRILWARKLLIVLPTISCVLGALVIALSLPSRWDAHARVMLNTLKSDPVTGQIMAGPSERNYAATQVELIKDYSVAGQVPPQLGWLTDPGFIEAYARRSKRDIRDFRHWLAQIVIDGTKAGLLEGSNIFDITYTSSDPAQAKAVVTALRQAYLDSDLSFRRADAMHDAEWNEEQAQKAGAALNAAQAAETEYERQNGIFMADAKTDVDTARLRAMSTQGAPMMAVTSSAGLSPAAAQLAELDASVTEARSRLGPNNPALQELEARRAALASIAAKERAAQADTSGTTAAQAAASQQAIQLQKARVLGESGKLGHLQQLQADVDTNSDQYNHLLTRVSDLREQASVVGSSLTPLGVATTGTKPAFPNKPLILGGGIVLGLATGFLLALLAELLQRRVRGVEDLATSIEAPVLAIIPTSSSLALNFARLRPQLGHGRRGALAVQT